VAAKRALSARTRHSRWLSAYPKFRHGEELLNFAYLAILIPTEMLWRKHPERFRHTSVAEKRLQLKSNEHLHF